MKAIYIPNGPQNLKSLFPNVDFNDVAEYYIQLNDSLSAVIATGTKMEIKSCGTLRIHFLNYLGAIDAINFKLSTKEHEPVSDDRETSLKYPLNKPDHN